MAAPSAAATARHPHLAESVTDGRWRVDLHSHTMWSGDSTTTPDEFAAAIVESGLDAVCVTDHHHTAGAFALAGQLQCEVIVGEEVRTPAGEIIGLFLTERLPVGGDHVAVAEAIRGQGGLVYIPHPFDPMRRNLGEEALYQLAESGLIDAIEVLNAKTSLSSLNQRAEAFADEFGLPGGAGSDAHVPDALGAAYVEIEPFRGAAEFLAALGSARVVGHHWDRARPWSPRVVPSVSA
jgi:predicted metal-dependent phosphoesterase TrpH